MTASHVPAKTIDGAKVLMVIFEEKGPGPKTGLSGEVALALGKKVSPREFADMIQYCRRVLGPQAGKAIIYHRPTDQYGFPEDIAQAERYIVGFNLKYLATRAETVLLSCKAAIAQRGDSPVLSAAAWTLGLFAREVRRIVDEWEANTIGERAARRTGVDAQTELEERVR